MQIDPTSLMNRAGRLSLDLEGTLRDPDLLPIDVLIDNLSTTGALLRTQGELPVGTLISLGIAGLGMQMARIVRVSPGALAAEFAEPLDSQAVARLASVGPSSSVAIPQLPGRSASPALESALPRAAALSPSIVSIGIDPLPGPRSGQITAALTYGTDGRAPLPPVEEQIPAIDARLLSAMPIERRALSTAIGGRAGLWLIMILVLATGLAMLLL